MAFVYIMQCQDFFKIGYTGNSPKDRLINMQSGNPFEINIVCTFQFSERKEAQKTESKLHRSFKDKNVCGEWFHLSTKDIAHIKKEYSQNLTKDLGLTEFHEYTPTTREKYWRTRHKNTRVKLLREEHKRICETKRLKYKIESLHRRFNSLLNDEQRKLYNEAH